MKTHYGNSLVNGKEEFAVGSLAVFPKVDEFYPGGATIACDETNVEGTKIAAGTAVAIDKVGGTVTLNAEEPTGLVYEDAYVGANGCTIAIVTKGQFNAAVAEVAPAKVPAGIVVVNL